MPRCQASLRQKSSSCQRSGGAGHNNSSKGPRDRRRGRGLHHKANRRFGCGRTLLVASVACRNNVSCVFLLGARPHAAIPPFSRPHAASVVCLKIILSSVSSSSSCLLHPFLPYFEVVRHCCRASSRRITPVVSVAMGSSCSGAML